MAHQPTEDADFNEVLITVIETTLNDTVGTEATEEFFTYLKTKVLIDKKDIPKEIIAFHAGLKKFFDKRAISIEDIIIGELFASIGLKISVKDTFPNLVRKARTYTKLSKARER